MNRNWCSRSPEYAKAHLMPKSLVISDGLACFRAVQDAEMLHLAVVTGGGAASVVFVVA